MLKICAETENVQLIFFYIEANVWLLLETFQCFLNNVLLLLKICLKRKKMCFLELCPLNKYFKVKKQIKIKMIETFQKPIVFMYFWLNYCNENYHIERIPVAVKNIDHLYNIASEITEAHRFHLFLLSDSTRIDNNEYLSSLENGTELIVCTKEQIQKLLICFELKRSKNISYPLNIDYRSFPISGKSLRNYLIRHYERIEKSKH